MRAKIQDLLKEANSSKEGGTSVNFAKRSFRSEIERSNFFDQTKRSLLMIDEWDKNSSPSSYKLFDNDGLEIGGEPISTGNFIRITLHGSGKYDWVEVVSIYDTPAEFVITVKPSYDPTTNPQDKTVISHFYVPEARNNFCLQNDGKTLSMYVIGIAERQNTESTGGVGETIRNAATANLGYYLGIQNATWTQFCSNFLK
ncbi:MAG: hypothetical protein WKF92_02220 [Pyrinomonadaceae bacterium]